MEAMSSEVADTNVRSRPSAPRALPSSLCHAATLAPLPQPYSRLMALKSLGVVKNYEAVRDFSVAIVGIGGVGVSVCEMLTRCGVGKIILYDFDTIELANMNKMFYRPEQAGWNKTMACRHYCSELNPDVAFEVHNMNICAEER